MGAKVLASAVLIDFGIADAITDKHRQYPASFVIPVPEGRARGYGWPIIVPTNTIMTPASPNATAAPGPTPATVPEPTTPQPPE
jgi:hypothetical protein